MFGLRGSGGDMERAFYFWTGLIVFGFFGFFAWWTYDTYDSDLSHTGLFWFSVCGAAVGVLLLLVAVIATAVQVGIREGAEGSSRAG